MSDTYLDLDYKPTSPPEKKNEEVLTAHVLIETPGVRDLCAP